MFRALTFCVHLPNALRKKRTVPVTGRSRTHAHDDSPDTAEAFRLLATLPDGPRRRALRDEVVTVWLPMAERIAIRFRGRGESLEDLYQVAALGLVKAVDGFAPARGTAFESYAIPTITGEIKRHFRDRMWMLHVPRRVQDLRNTVRKELVQLSSGQATVAEIASRTRLSEDEVREGMRALDCYAAMSLDAERFGGEGAALGDEVGEPDSGYDLVVDRVSAGPLIADLPERERTILYLRFFRGMTQSAIAAELGISQMHVSRLLSTCFIRLREQVLQEEE